MNEATSILVPESFVDDKNRAVFETMVALNGRLDILTLANDLENRKEFLPGPGIDRPDIFVTNLSNHIDMGFVIRMKNNLEVHASHLNGISEDRSVWKFLEELKKNPPGDYPGGLAAFSIKSLGEIQSKYPKPKSRIFIPDWTNRPSAVDPIVSLKGISILTKQNSSAISAKPGFGKSSVVEAIGSACLNPESDNLGFSVFPGCRTLIVDTERSKIDVYNAFERLCRRAGIAHGDQSVFEKVKFVGMRRAGDHRERRSEIENQIREWPCDLIVIDQAADLAMTEDSKEAASDYTNWIKFIIEKFIISIIVTLHPNPGSEKLRGHQGSELMRDCETVLTIQDFEECKKITSDFEHGKNRNSEPISAGMKWSDDQKMFVSIDLDQVAGEKQINRDYRKRQQAAGLIGEIMPAPNSLSYKDLVSAIMDRTSKKAPTAKKLITDLLGWKIVEKGNDGYYRMIV
jgi:hypothetical protein